jgi:hypothetical protein
MAKTYPYSRLRSDDGERERIRLGDLVRSGRGELSRGMSGRVVLVRTKVEFALQNYLRRGTQKIHVEKTVNQAGIRNSLGGLPGLGDVVF